MSILGDPYARPWTWAHRGTRIGTFAVVMGMVITLIIILAVTGSRKEASGHDISIPDVDRFDCAPDLTNSAKPRSEFAKVCSQRGCLYLEGNAKDPRDYLALKCVYPKDYQNYVIDSTYDQERGKIIILKKTSRESGFPNEVKIIKVEIINFNENLVRVKISDAIQDRWEPPLPKLSLPGKESNATSQKYLYSVEDGILKISRRSSSVVVFSTDLKQVIFNDHFLQLIDRVPSNKLYGFGEHLDNHLKSVSTVDGKVERKKYSFHNFGDLIIPDKPAYGTHPFYLMFEEDNSAHGLLFHNSNPHDIVMSSTPALTFRTIGGVLDFFIFMGPSADEVMQQKQALIGGSPLPPFWSLGFHLCRYGYKSSDEMMQVHKRNFDAGLPIDVQWADIDYMDNFNMFTYDKDKFGSLPEKVEELHKGGRHFIAIIDPSFDGTQDKESAGWPAYQEGSKLDIWVKNASGLPLVGKVWNKLSVWPDFTHPKTGGWWKRHMKIFHDQVPYDGLWIDMNEPSTFINGQLGGCSPNQRPDLDQPPFNPVGKPVDPMDLENTTICMSSQHYIGPHLDVHNLFAYYEAQMTSEGLSEIRDERPFVLSRATTTGQGQYSAHWTGDIQSNWDYLKLQIPQILDFNLFGIPFVGADICGFIGDTTRELCARWHSVGAFYTFTRNHNDISRMSQDPASPEMGGPNGEVFNATQYALTHRYSLLPFLYSLFFRNSLYGNPIIRSLKFNYPTEKYDAIDQQFMWGRELLINPITEEGKTKGTFTFPPGRWYDLETKKIISQGGEEKEIDIPIDRINLAIREGSIIPMHEPKQTTTEQRKYPFILAAFLDSNEKAEGELFYDDGKSLTTIEFETYLHVTFKISDKTLTTNITVDGYVGEEANFPLNAKTTDLAQISIYGIKDKVTSVEINGTSMTDFHFDENNRSLTIAGRKDTTSISYPLKDLKVIWK